VFEGGRGFGYSNNIAITALSGLAFMEAGNLPGQGKYGREVRAWNEVRDPEHPLRLSVNLSARQLDQPGLAEEIGKILADSRMDPSTLVVEITEQVFMQDSEHVLVNVQALKELGVHLAIDDFGTGYSSLSYLQRFPVDYLKIDKSFVSDLGEGPTLARAVVDKRELGEQMRGYPVARTTSARGEWVYTLYTRSPGGGRPFVHALNAAARTAFCIDLPSWPDENIWEARLELTNDGGELVARSGATAVATIDTATLKVR